jgi:hypothetical protein
MEKLDIQSPRNWGSWTIPRRDQVKPLFIADVSASCVNVTRSAHRTRPMSSSVCDVSLRASHRSHTIIDTLSLLVTLSLAMAGRESIDRAFAGDANLRKRISEAIGTSRLQSRKCYCWLTNPHRQGSSVCATFPGHCPLRAERTVCPRAPG